MLCHWDDVPVVDLARGDLAGRRRRLGAAAGAQRLGLSRFDLGPGERPMPVHVHGDEEELFFVLEGSGVSFEKDQAFPIATGDAIRYPASGAPHTVVAGPEGMVVLAFGSGSDSHLTYLPRAKAMWAGPRWIPPDGPSPFALEVEAGALELPEPTAERPPTIVAAADVEPQERRRGDIGQVSRRIGGALEATRCGLQAISVDPGRFSNPPHCHSAEEELFVVVGGTGGLELLHPDGTAESHPVRAGHVVSRPAGTGVAHTFGAGDQGLELLAFSNDEPADMCFYPRSGKISIRGLKTVFRIQRVDYWDGEE